MSDPTTDGGATTTTGVLGVKCVPTVLSRLVLLLERWGCSRVSWDGGGPAGEDVGSSALFNTPQGVSVRTP